MNTNSRVLTLKIDDQDIGAQEDQTILEAARDHGIHIPTLCHLDGLTDIGACRLCLVEITGQTRLQAACVARVGEGMEVVTDSDRLRRYRRTIVEMLFAERNHVCAVCVSNGHCNLQRLAEELGMTHVHMPYLHATHRVDASHERFVLDHNRCVLCSRCVRVCDEIEGAHVWDLLGRGVDTRVITDLNQPWGTSQTCTGCGKCVHVCPTGALTEKGKTVQEMSVEELRKRSQYLPYLTLMRGGRDGGGR